MYFANEHHILIVDDEPDVLLVTKLALASVKVYGVPLRVHTAASRAEAIELLNSTLATQMSGFSLAAVAFIDVVMETDQAGLELCQYMRETMQNAYTQLYVRTGQPGIVPERDVIDRYDINGYVTKVEATEDKLYALIRTGVREYILLSYLLIQDAVLQVLIAESHSRDALRQVADAGISAFQSGPSDRQQGSLDIAGCLIVDEEVIAGSFGTGADAIARRDQFLTGPSRAISPDGDALYVDGRESLLKIAASDTNAELYYLSRGTVPPPDFLVSATHGYYRSLAALWKVAG